VKRILVTGGAKRLGLALVEGLRADGHQVVAHGFRSGAGEDQVITADLRRPGAGEALIEEAARRLGGLDVLVNGACCYPKDSLESLTWEGFQEALTLGAWAPFELARAFFRRGKGGLILNVLDARMDDLEPERLAYHWSKRLLRDMTRELAVLMAPQVRVNAIAPGAVLPPEGLSPEFLEEARQACVLKRLPEVDGVLAAARYLIAGEHVTGEILRVCGGRHLRGRIYE
jgi:NAD(P)-dependent dehydrogenase (short-subunit alcohol dehydrogenase family)